MKTKVKNILLISVALGFSVIFIFTGGGERGGKTDETGKANLIINNVELKVEIADNHNERARGLSGRDYLASDNGMFFIFEKPGRYSFWMKEMNFPIDIIWVGEDLIIKEITENILPDTYPKSFYPAEDIKYVLETNAGFTGKNKILPGQKLIFAEN